MWNPSENIDSVQWEFKQAPFYRLQHVIQSELDSLNWFDTASINQNTSVA